MKFDIVILGGGPGGYVAAIKGAQLGYKVALIEKNNVGGVCLNEGCIPTKTLLKSAKVMRLFQHATDYGIKVDQAGITFDWTDIQKRKSKVIKSLTDGVKGLLKKNGVTLIHGYGEVIDSTHVKVADDTIETTYLILATGASPIIPPIDGLHDAIEHGFVYTYKDLLDYDKIPKTLSVIGGGVIGLEFAQLFASFGTKVTIIERQKEILMPVDDDIRQVYLRQLKKDKIDIITNANVINIKDNTLTYQKDNDEVSLSSDVILLSVGMKPNTASFSHLDLKMTKSGVLVDHQLKTNIKNVYAIGDLTGKMMLAHAASAAGTTAIEAISGKKVSFTFDHVPQAIYGFPEIAWIGLSEQDAKTSHIKYKSSKFPLLANGRSLAEGQTDGFVKVLINPENGEIIGAHIIASNASDLLAEVVLAIKSEATIADIANAIHLHPTVSETVMESAIGAVSKPLHI